MRTSIIFLFLVTLTIISFSQVERLKVIKAKNGTISSVEFPLENAMEEITPKTGEDFFKGYLNVKPDDQFIEEPIKSRISNINYQYYKQFYKGIAVYGGGYTFHYLDGRMLFAHGHYVPIAELSVEPTITPVEAKDNFARYKNIPLDSVIDFRHQLIIKEIEHIQGNDTTIAPMLVYRISLIANHPNNNEVGFII